MYDPQTTEHPAAERDSQADDPLAKCADTRPHSPLHGLSWDMLRDILRAPSRARTPIIELALLLTDEPATRTTVQAAAARMKTTEIAVLEAVSRMPHLFRLESSGHRIALRIPGQDPAVLSPRQLEQRAKLSAKEGREAARLAREVAADAENTPANHVREALESTGLERRRARSFARSLVTGYGEAASLEAAAHAAASKPANIEGWITSYLRRRIEGSAITKRPARVLPFIRPTGTRETTFIGWTATHPRMKLYRLPEGRIKEVAPERDEAVPSLTEDAGCIVR